MIYAVVSIAILSTMILAVARAVKGPSMYDRVLAANMFGTKTVLLIAVLAIFTGRSDIVDIALVYTLVNFIAIIAVLRFFEYSKQGDSND